MDRDSQIKAIEKTFEDNKKPIERHYSKPNVVPVEILPVYPDFKVTPVLLCSDVSVKTYRVKRMSCYSFVFVIFSCGNIHVHKSYSILILRQPVDLYPHRLKKCHKL